ncbi:hypothetical protein STEG23_029055, partial [Scotinomys teguina]
IKLPQICWIEIIGLREPKLLIRVLMLISVRMCYELHQRPSVLWPVPSLGSLVVFLFRNVSAPGPACL